MRQTWGTHYIDFLYDESGTPYSLVYDGVQYYYVKNVQGDVVQIRSVYGTLLVEYTYDAWGNVLSITGSNASVLGANNPIRYRSYYYDFETGFYYLNSRYYDPAVKRFINADGYVNANGDFIGFNMYAYCGNNPINRIDPTGDAWWHWALGAAVVVGFAALTVVTCGGSLAAAATAVGMVGSGSAAFTTASTVAAGAFIGSTVAYGTAVAAAAITSNSLEEFNDQGNWGTVVATGIGAAVGGYSGYAIAREQLPQSVSQKINSGTSRAPEHGAEPNSRYLQYDQSTGKLRCDVVYNANGDWYSRVDYMHPHKINGVPYMPHIHFSAPLDQFGRPIGREYIFPW